MILIGATVERIRRIKENEMKFEDKFIKVFTTLVVWVFLIGVSLIAIGFIVRGILSVWSFIL